MKRPRTGVCKHKHGGSSAETNATKANACTAHHAQHTPKRRGQCPYKTA